ncbi:MAG: hypothetical protein IK095_04995 [Oscillospiraceae bacterium]|nr:hypothetical protein [Oscillospiraceae bacterium]
MATEMEINNALAACGFGNLNGVVFYGAWKGYPITLRKIAGRSFYVDAAAALDAVPGALRRALGKELKDKGVKMGAPAASGKARVCFTTAVSTKEDAAAILRMRLDAIVEALRHNGVAPASVCAVTGSPRPDALCLVDLGGVPSYQPVASAAIRQKNEQVKAQAEENELNGSYALGFVGALLGMLAGLIPNLLTVIFAERIFALLFALVPICAMLGYKLFKGKMTKGSVAIVIAVSVVGVLLMPMLEIVFYLMRDYGDTFGEALGDLGLILREPSFSGQIGAELVQLLIFMALGILIAWRFISGQTNSSAAKFGEIQLASLRPLPGAEQADYAQRAPYGYDPMTGAPLQAPAYDRWDSGPADGLN